MRSLNNIYGFFSYLQFITYYYYLTCKLLFGMELQVYFILRTLRRSIGIKRKKMSLSVILCRAVYFVALSRLFQPESKNRNYNLFLR